MKPIAAILTVLILSSCVTERKRAKICATCPTHTETVVKDSIVYRDTAIAIPPKLIRDTFKILCPDGGVPIIKGGKKRSGTMQVQIQRLTDSIFVNTCVVDSEAVYLKLKDRYRTESTTVTFKESNDWTRWLLGGLFILLLIAFLLFYKRNR